MDDESSGGSRRYARCFPLLVEDDPAYRLLLTRAFEKAGVFRSRVRTAEDGASAIDLLSRVTPGAALLTDLPPSLIVLDLSLPRKSGLEVLQWIRSSPVLSESPVFMLTSSERPDHIARAFELGTDSYFIKPAPLEELQKVVDGMLGYWYIRAHRRMPGPARPPDPENPPSA